MKLPYARRIAVQSLGRPDVGSAAREWQAEQQVSEAKTGAFLAAGQMVSDVTDMIASDETKKASLIYKQAMEDWSQNAEYYDENGVAGYVNGEQRYAEAEKKARELASKNLTIAKSKNAFSTSADEMSLRYKSAWSGKVTKGYKDDQLTVGYDTYQSMMDNRDYNGAIAAIDDMRTKDLLTPSQHYKMEQTTRTTQLNNEIGERISRITTVAEADKLRADIAATGRLSESAKRKHNAVIDNRVIKTTANQMRIILSDHEEVFGPVAAAKEAQRLLVEATRISADDRDGVQVEARPQLINALKSVANDFKVKGEASVGFINRAKKVQNVMDGKEIPDKGTVDDLYQMGLGRKPLQKSTGFDIDTGLTDKQVLSDTPEGLAGKMNFINTYRQYGVFSESMNDLVNKSFRNQDTVRAGVQLIKGSIDSRPGAITIKDLPIPDDFIDVINVFDEEYSTAAISRYLQKNSSQRKFDAQAFEIENKEVDMDKMLKKHMPDKGWIFDSVPKAKTSFLLKVEQQAKRLYPLVDNDLEAAYTAAFDHARQYFDVDQYTGKVVSGSIQRTILFGDVDKGEWAHRQIQENIFNEYGVEPKSYEYIRTKDFDPEKNPTLLVTWIDDENRYHNPVPVTLDFKSTPEGRAYLEDSEAQYLDTLREKNATKIYQEFLKGEAEWSDVPLSKRVQLGLDRTAEIYSDMEEAKGSIRDDIIDKVMR